MEKSIIKAVKNANLTVNEDEILTIISGMSQDDINDTGKLGTKHWKVLRDLTKKRMEEEIKVKEEDIVNRYFIWGVCGFGPVTIATTGGVFYNRIVVTENKLFVYGFDQLFRCVERHNINISDIEDIAQGKAGKYGILPCDGAIIKSAKAKVILLGKDVYSRKDIGDLINDLTSRNSDLSQENIFE